MIVLSGVLVLPALVLLALGLRTGEISLVHASIAVSLVSFAFLIVGVLQRRDDPVPLDTPPADGSAHRTAEPVGQPATVSTDVDVDTDADVTADTRPGTVGTGAPALTAVVAESGVEDEDDDGLEPGGGPVLVVVGRPRYHVEGCRYLSDREAEELDVLDAREDGFTACGVCTPDQVLEAIYGEIPGAPVPAGRLTAEELDTGLLTSEELHTEDDGPVARQAPAIGSVPMFPPATSAPGAASAVVVIPDRDRFHAADCRFVRGALGTQELSRTQAAERGFVACGVCKP